MELVLSYFRMFHNNIPAHVRSALYMVGAVVGGVVLVVKVVGYVKQRQDCQERQGHVKDVVYFYTFPGAAVVPNISPFGFKLETWLRMANIRYESRRSVFYQSRKEQSPFVVLNGEEIPDSNVIIERLSRHFHVDPEENLSEDQKAVSLALQRMIENHTCWSYGYFRWLVNLRQLLTTVNAPLLLYPFLGLLVRKEIMRKFYHHGMGRHSQDEIAEMGCEDIRALSVVLGERPYMMGEKPTKVDTVVFAHLAQIVYFPQLGYPHMAVLREECRNLLDYVDRMKDEFWPDWEQACRAV